MPEYTAILRSLSQEKFIEIVAASPRQARETYFHRHQIRAPKSSHLSLKIGRKNQACTEALWDVLQARDDEEMSETILRAWLLRHRPMLAAALDHMGIAHVDGLTESDDIQKISQMDAAQLRKLADAIEKKQVASGEDIALYLRYMGATDVDAIFKSAS